MATKTYTLSASRAGFGSVVVTVVDIVGSGIPGDPGTIPLLTVPAKTQVISNVGVIGFPAITVVTAGAFVIHPFV